MGDRFPIYTALNCNDAKIEELLLPQLSVLSATKASERLYGEYTAIRQLNGDNGNLGDLAGTRFYPFSEPSSLASNPVCGGVA